MIKYLGIILVIILLGAGVYFFTIQKGNQQKSIEVSFIKTTQNVTPTPLITTDQAITDDMTALEKDLINLDAENNSLENDLKTL